MKPEDYLFLESNTLRIYYSFEPPGFKTCFTPPPEGVSRVGAVGTPPLELMNDLEYSWSGVTAAGQEVVSVYCQSQIKLV